jgi:transcriptional regulator with XRE-family HTH domain
MEQELSTLNIGSKIVALRREMQLSQSDFGEIIGLASKGKVSVLESSGRASLPVALKIEELSIQKGFPRIDAAELNEDVARARMACLGECAEVHSPTDTQEAETAQDGKSTGVTAQDIGVCV